MSDYILLQPDEDGNPVTWVETPELEDIKHFMEDYGITEFITDFPDGEKDPNYWGEGQAMLLSVNVKRVVPVEVATKFEIQ